MDSIGVLWSLSIVFISLSIYYHFRVFSFWKRRGIPGPTPWPIFGTNIYYIFENKLKLESKWKQQYGRTYGMFEGYWPMLRTTDANIIKQIYVKHFQTITDRNHKFIYNKRQRRFMLWSLGDHWSNQRALVSPMFTASRMRHSLATMSICVDRFIEKAEERMSTRSTKSGDDIGEHMSRSSSGQNRSASFDKFDMSALTLDVIASSFFGLKIDTYKATEEKDEFVVNALKFADFSLFRFIVWSLLPRLLGDLIEFDLLSAKCFEYFHRLSKKIIKERRQNPESRRDDVIQALMDAKLTDNQERVFTELDNKEAHYSDNLDQKQLEKLQKKHTEQAKHFAQFDDDAINGMISFFMLAGFETTASTLTFALHELAYQSKIQEKLVEEIKQTFGPRGEKFSNDIGENNYKNLLDLKYLDAFVSEVLRIYAPVVEHNRLVTNKLGVELEINGRLVQLPYFTGITTNQFIVHRDPEYFVQPDEFKIERFLPENKDKIKQGSFGPFGLGPRHCVGMRFALLEIKCALAKLLLHFQVCPADVGEYPPTFKQNVIFLQYQNTNFKLVPREIH